MCACNTELSKKNVVAFWVNNCLLREFNYYTGFTFQATFYVSCEIFGQSCSLLGQQLLIKGVCYTGFIFPFMSYCQMFRVIMFGSLMRRFGTLMRRFGS